MPSRRLPLITVDTESELIDLEVIEFERRQDAEWLENVRRKAIRASKREDNLSRRRWKRSLREHRKAQHKEVHNA